MKPNEEFFQSFSGVVGCKWPYIAGLFSLSSDELQEVKREGRGQSQRDLALLMLRKWANRKEGTYGQLFDKLKPMSFFNVCK